jgi:hypothetical protein
MGLQTRCVDQGRAAPIKWSVLGAPVPPTCSAIRYEAELTVLRRLL